MKYSLFVFVRSPTHFVFVQDIPGDLGACPIEKGDRPEKPRGSVHSLRRGSFDVRSIGSDVNRRTSLAKLHAMPLEAPITKVLYINQFTIDLKYTYKDNIKLSVL